MRLLLLPGPLLLLLGACNTPKESDEHVAADREDVKHALHRQFDEVLQRYQALEGDDSEEAADERADLEALANRIAERIVRLDPNADVDTLVRRLEQMR